MLPSAWHRPGCQGLTLDMGGCSEHQLQDQSNPIQSKHCCKSIISFQDCGLSIAIFWEGTALLASGCRRLGWAVTLFCQKQRPNSTGIRAQNFTSKSSKTEVATYGNVVTFSNNKTQGLTKRPTIDAYLASSFSWSTCTISLAAAPVQMHDA